MPFLEFHPWVLHLKRSSNTESSFGVGSSRAKANFSFTRYCENCKLSPVSTAHEAPESLAYWVLRSSQLCPLIGELSCSEYCLRLWPSKIPCHLSELSPSWQVSFGSFVTPSGSFPPSLPGKQTDCLLRLLCTPPSLLPLSMGLCGQPLGRRVWTRTARFLG